MEARQKRTPATIPFAPVAYAPGSARWWVLLSAGLVIGCQDARPEVPQTAQPDKAPASSLSSRFDPGSCGTIEGRVIWEGPSPKAPAFRVYTNDLPNKKHLCGMVRENPNAPLVQPVNRGVHESVVFLRAVEPARSRPWRHAPVRIEQTDFRMKVHQGEKAVGAGIVRQGEEVAMLSRDPAYHCLRGRGADFFSFTFVDKDRPTVRRLHRRGLVELSSGAGHYWMRGYLFVDEHPYYALTDHDGRFRLDQVPAGQYQLVCWHPSWEVVRREREPETGLVSRVFFAAPLQQEKTVVVDRAKTTTIDFGIGTLPASGLGSSWCMRWIVREKIGGGNRTVSI